MDKKYYLSNQIFRNTPIKCLHAFYSKKFKNTRLFLHRNLNNDKDYQYYKRCITRFNKIKNNKIYNKLFVRINFCSKKISKIDDETMELNTLLSKYFTNYYILIINFYHDIELKTNIVKLDNIFVLDQSYLNEVKTFGTIVKDNESDNSELHKSICSLFNFDLLDKNNK